MRLPVLTSCLAFALVAAKPHYGRASLTEWSPPGPGDVRGPCPMMNTLANHAFLPHDGRNITKENAIFALNTGLNFDQVLAGIMWDQAIISNPEPNATFFTLDNLNRHNILEHDASISRSDALFGNNHIFNQTIFDTTLQYWTNETLTADMLANGKLARQLESKVTNPTYRFTDSVENFSVGEMAAPILVFGDIAAATANRTLVKFMFENEKLPFELGWSRALEPVFLDNITHISTVVRQAASLITPMESAQAVVAGRANLHSGFLV